MYRPITSNEIESVMKNKNPPKSKNPGSDSFTGKFYETFREVWFSSVTQLSLTLWDPMDCSIPFFPVHHQYLELAKTHVHLVGHAIQPSHPLLSLSPPAFNLSQHQGLFH